MRAQSLRYLDFLQALWCSVYPYLGLLGLLAELTLLSLCVSQITQWASLVAQLVKNLPVMQETWVRSSGWEDPLEKGKATHSSILAWRIPWTL